MCALSLAAGACAADCAKAAPCPAATNAVTLTLPSGYTYESFKGASPLVIPANSHNILTVTRTADNVFLVTREELETVQ